MQRLIGVLLILISAASLGVMPIFAQVAYTSGADPIAVLFLRFTIASLVLLVLLFSRKPQLPRRSNLLGFILIGAVGCVLQSLCYFTALTFASASSVAFIFYLYPTIVTILAIVLCNESATTPKLITLVLGSVGMGLTVGLEGAAQPLGILLALCSAIVYASCVIGSSTLIKQEAVIPAATVITTSAAIGFAGILTTQEVYLPTTGIGWAAIVAIALISTVLPIVTLLAGMKRISPTHASILSMLEPVVAAILATMSFGEAMTPTEAVGGLLILTAVLLLAKAELLPKTALLNRRTSVPSRISTSPPISPSSARL